jgi:hypothetical protein
MATVCRKLCFEMLQPLVCEELGGKSVVFVQVSLNQAVSDFRGKTENIIFKPSQRFAHSLSQRL